MSSQGGSSCKTPTRLGNKSSFLKRGDVGSVTSWSCFSLRCKSKAIRGPSVSLENQRKVNAVLHSLNTRIFDSYLNISHSFIYYLVRTHYR